MKIEPDRDRWGRPLITPLNGVEPIAHVRPSSLPEHLNDDFNLSRWRQRQLILGLGQRKDLWLLAAIADANDAKTLDEIITAAQAMVAANTGSAFGSAVHGILERDITNRPDLEAAMIAAEGVRTALAKVGLSRVPDTAEMFVINDAIQAAGSWDGLVANADGELFVFDIKTAADILDRRGNVHVPDYKAQAWAVQTATYANSRRTWTLDGAAANPWHPSVTESKIAYVSRTSGDCVIVSVDLVAGWEAAQLARRVYDWKRRKVADLVTFDMPDLLGVLAASIEMVKRGAA